MNEKLAAMYEKIQPKMVEIRARYPESFNLDGLEPAISNDVAELVLEQLALFKQELLEKVEGIKDWVFTTPYGLEKNPEGQIVPREHTDDFYVKKSEIIALLTQE